MCVWKLTDNINATIRFFFETMTSPKYYTDPSYVFYFIYIFCEMTSH